MHDEVGGLSAIGTQDTAFLLEWPFESPAGFPREMATMHCQEKGLRV